MPQDHVGHIVKSHESNTRLDTLVSGLLPDGNAVSRAAVSRAIRSGLITVNGRRNKPSYRVKSGDRIAGTVPSAGLSTDIAPDPALRLPIVFEDDAIIVIDKPAGILTHPTPALKTGTVANWAVAHDPRIAAVGDDPLRPGIVHRLDRDTSGLLIIAKTQEAFLALKTAFQRHKIKKTYIALVHGRPEPATGRIDTSIARALRGDRQAAASPERKTTGKTRPAVTEYVVLARSDDQSLIEARPKTGRTHQIRVHLASIGHPVVGDRLYGIKATRAEDRTIPHHLLHAARLEFTLFGERYAFESPLPEEWPSSVRGLVAVS